MKQIYLQTFGKTINGAIVLYSALAIISLILIGYLGISILKKPHYKDVHQEMTELATLVHQQYQKRPDYWGLNSEKILKNESLPTPMKKHQKIVSHIGREIIIGSNVDGDMVMPGGRQFMLTMDNLSRNVCIGLLSDIETLKTDPAWESLIVYNENGTTEFSWSADNSLADLPHKASEICVNRNKISWLFH